MSPSAGRAIVVGAGPNGLSAAIVLAQAGMAVEVFEAESEPGGAVRTMQLTLPGFHHDFGSAVYPMAAASPFFSSLPLHHHGLQWIHSPAVLAHPFDDGTAIALERDIQTAARNLGIDGAAWQQLLGPLAEHWTELAAEILRPPIHIPHHPLLLARFGLKALQPAAGLAKRCFRSPRTQALFAGLAAHSFLALDEPLSASFGLVLGATAHAVGWPIPRGGAQSITHALLAHLASLGGRVNTESRVERLASLGEFSAALCDVAPRQLVQIAGERFNPGYNRTLVRYRHGPSVFKVDYALSQPIPWKAPDCLRAATVHLGGSIEEIAASEYAMRHGHHCEKPFVLLAQPTLFDPSRAPRGKHIAWAYCHAPYDSNFDMLPAIDAQIERFAPGFGECILARRCLKPTDLQSMDSNLVGGDIVGGTPDWRQLLFRPSWRQYATPEPAIYLCSASTPPGGGVHGMCGYNAAMLALSRPPLTRNHTRPRS